MGICSAFNNYFSCIGGQLAQNFVNTENPLGSMTYRNVIRFVFTPAIYEYVLDIVSKLNDSCAGFDMKPMWVYKIIFFSNLGHVMTGTFPTKFKIAKVITLHKNGCLKTVSNLRPILCSLGKILEKIVHHKFYDYFDFYYLFSKKHFGLGKV